MTLSNLSDAFTHYDLHDYNVLVYEPVAGSHIDYHYHLENETLSFKSHYLAKMIDYGRCYYKDDTNSTSTGNSQEFYKELCRRCKPGCGPNAGFDWLEYNKSRIKEAMYISSQVSNVSHDLRLLSILSKMPIRNYAPTLATLLKKAVYGVNVRQKYKIYGTKPNPDSGLPKKLNNVNDAFKAFLELARTSEERERNIAAYEKSNKLGDLHVYADGQNMKYIPA
jgi:hypothetical protein